MLCAMRDLASRRVAERARARKGRLPVPLRLPAARLPLGVRGRGRHRSGAREPLPGRPVERALPGSPRGLRRRLHAQRLHAGQPHLECLREALRAARRARAASRTRATTATHEPACTPSGSAMRMRTPGCRARAARGEARDVACRVAAGREEVGHHHDLARAGGDAACDRVGRAGQRESRGARSRSCRPGRRARERRSDGGELPVRRALAAAVIDEDDGAPRVARRFTSSRRWRGRGPCTRAWQERRREAGSRSRARVSRSSSASGESTPRAVEDLEIAATAQPAPRAGARDRQPGRRAPRRAAWCPPAPRGSASRARRRGGAGSSRRRACGPGLRYSPPDGHRRDPDHRERDPVGQGHRHELPVPVPRAARARRGRRAHPHHPRRRARDRARGERAVARPTTSCSPRAASARRTTTSPWTAWRSPSAARCSAATRSPSASSARRAGRRTRASSRWRWFPRTRCLIDAGDLWFPVVVVENVYVFPGIPELLRKKFESVRERFRGVPVLLKTRLREAARERHRGRAERAARAVPGADARLVSEDRRGVASTCCSRSSRATRATCSARSTRCSGACRRTRSTRSSRSWRPNRPRRARVLSRVSASRLDAAARWRSSAPRCARASRCGARAGSASGRARGGVSPPPAPREARAAAARARLRRAGSLSSVLAARLGRVRHRARRSSRAPRSRRSSPPARSAGASSTARSRAVEWHARLAALSVLLAAAALGTGFVLLPVARRRRASDGALAQPVVGEHEADHRLDHRHGARQHARVVAAAGREA